MRAASDIPLGESARFSASLDEQFLSEVEVCTPSEADVYTPSEADVCTPSGADVCTPSGAVYPERSRGVGLLL